MIPFEGVYRLQALRCERQHVGNRTRISKKLSEATGPRQGNTRCIYLYFAAAKTAEKLTPNQAAKADWKPLPRLLFGEQQKAPLPGGSGAFSVQAGSGDGLQRLKTLEAHPVGFLFRNH